MAVRIDNKYYNYYRRSEPSRQPRPDGRIKNKDRGSIASGTYPGLMDIGQVDKKNTKYNNYGKQGHWAKEYRAPKAKKKGAYRNYGKEGHWAKDCKSPRMDKVPEGKVVGGVGILIRMVNSEDRGDDYFNH